MHPPPSLPSRPWLVLSASLAVLLAAGCATAPRKPAIVYPPPPDRTRIVHVRSFTRAQDLRRGFFSKLADALVPHGSGVALAGPTGLALSPDEQRLYVVSTPGARVVRVDLSSGKFGELGGGGGPGGLKVPVGVAVDADENVYVGDKGLDAVLVYDRDGRHVRTLGKDRLLRPTEVAIDRKRQVLYVVNDAVTKEGKHTVEVFSLAGEHLRTMGGGRTNEPGSLYFPSALAVSPAGELFVSDMLNFRVQVFAADGRLVRMFGEQGLGTGLFDKIHGIGFDTFGNVYVVDVLLGVQIFNDKAQPLMSFGQGVTQVPLGLVVDSRNHIFVTDYTNAVHEFALVNTSAGDSYAAPADAAPSAAPGAPRAAGAPASASPGRTQ